MHGTHAGWHLTYDGIVHPEHVLRLNDIEFLQEVLLKLVEFLGMQVLDGPRLHRVEFDRSKVDSDEDEGGVTGILVLTTSHISIHTWPLRERFSLDIFSCREFDEDTAQALIEDLLKVKKRSSHWIQRTWP